MTFGAALLGGLVLLYAVPVMIVAGIIWLGVRAWHIVKREGS